MTLHALHSRRAAAAACLLFTIACTGPSAAPAGTSSAPPACTITGTASADQLVGTGGDDVMAERFSEMTRAVSDQFALMPNGGVHNVVVPHLTIAIGDTPSLIGWRRSQSECSR
jgi:hypothetical protein